MNTVGVLFESKTKSYQAAPDFAGKFTLTRPFIEDCIAAFKRGQTEAKIEGRWKRGGAVEWINLSLIPPKEP